jgi:hypothetical protein
VRDPEGEAAPGAAVAPPRPLRVPLWAWREDADRDGLGDLLERRLWLDPRRADSDGDGVDDSRDPVPNAAPPRPGAPPDDAGGLAVAALAALWACEPPEARQPVLFVAGTAPLEWRGHRGPVLTARGTPAEVAAMGLGYQLLEVDAAADAAGPLAPGERRVHVRQGGLEGVEGAEAYPPLGIVLRRLDGRWTVTRFEHPTAED